MAPSDAAPGERQGLASWDGPPNYNGLEILSPMVRASALPLRLCALQYGADLVYSGVEIDSRIISSKRVEDDTFGCIDYVAKDGHVTYKTCPEERGRNIFQLGTADAALATKAALHVCHDVRGIDVNMGCTAPFSAKGGMGCALLEKPDVAADILKALRRELPAECAVTCKIRMLPTIARTRDFMQLCEQSGVSAVAVHMRTPSEQSELPAHWDDISNLCSAVKIPVIANGDFLSRDHITRFWSRLGRVRHDNEVAAGQNHACSEEAAGPAALMVARGALWNPAIFHKEEFGQMPTQPEVVARFIQNSLRVNNPSTNTKWVLTEMMTPGSCCPNESFAGLKGRALKRLRSQLREAKGMKELCTVFGEAYNASAHPPNAHTMDYYNRQYEFQYSTIGDSLRCSSENHNVKFPENHATSDTSDTCDTLDSGIGPDEWFSL